MLERKTLSHCRQYIQCTHSHTLVCT